MLIQKYRENGIRCAKDLLGEGAQWGRKKRKDDRKDFPMVTKFQESFSQTDWGVLKSLSQSHPQEESYLIEKGATLVPQCTWEWPTRSMVSGKYDG